MLAGGLFQNMNSMMNQMDMAMEESMERHHQQMMQSMRRAREMRHEMMKGFGSLALGSGLSTAGLLHDHHHHDHHALPSHRLHHRHQQPVGDHGSGSYHSESKASTVVIGADGRPVHVSKASNVVVESHDPRSGHREKFVQKHKASGYGSTKVSETHQAYENSASGNKKVAVERSIGGAGRKIVSKFDAHGNEYTSEYLKNLEDEEKEHFEAEWRARAGGKSMIANVPHSSRRSSHREYTPPGSAYSHRSSPRSSYGGSPRSSYGASTARSSRSSRRLALPSSRGSSHAMVPYGGSSTRRSSASTRPW